MGNPDLPYGRRRHADPVPDASALRARAVSAGYPGTAGPALRGVDLSIPVAAASLVAKSLPRVLPISAAIAPLSGVAGLYASYYLDVASGAAIVLACTACFVSTSAVRAARGGVESLERRGEG